MVDARAAWPPARAERSYAPQRSSRQHMREMTPSPEFPNPGDMFLEDESLAYGFDEHYDGEPPSLSDLRMADSQISDLDISTEISRNRSIPMRPRQHHLQGHPRPETRQTPRAPVSVSERDWPRNLQSNRRSPPREPRNRQSSGGSYAGVPEPKHDAYTYTAQQRALGRDFDDDDFGHSDGEDETGMVDIDARQLPDNPNESQQDLAERINQLTRTINANAQLCLETSRKMVAIAQENKHLAYEAGAQLDTYVLQPALKLGQALRTYCPGVDEGVQALWEYEAQLRKRVVNGLNGRDSLFQPGGIGGRRGKEVERLKDRLIEQDALLRDSSQHIRKLMTERDKLRKKLDEDYERNGSTSGNAGGGGARLDPIYRDMDDILGEGQAIPRNARSDGVAVPRSGPRQRTGSHAEDAQLAEQLGELRVLVDRLPVLRDVPSSQESKSQDTASTHLKSSGHADEDDDDEWTLL